MLGTIFLYNFILLGSTLFVYLSEKAKSPIGRGICIFIAFLIVFLPAAFRYEIGIDYYSYVDIFNNITNDQDTKMEMGFYLLNRLLIVFGIPIEGLFILVSFLTYLFVFSSYTIRYAAIFHFLYFSLFYFTNFTFIRSDLAIAIVLFSICTYVNNGKIIRYVIWILIASLFHKSAIIFLPLVFCDLKICRALLMKTRVLIDILLILIFVFSANIIILIIDSNVLEILGYQQYARDGHFSTPMEVGTGLGILVKFLLLLVGIVFSRRFIEINPRNIIFVVLAICCALFLSLSLSMRIFSRAVQLFSIAYIFSVLSVYQIHIVPMFMRKITVLFFMCFWLYTYNVSIVNGSTDYTVTCDGDKITPYVSIFNKEDSQRDPVITRTNQGCKAILLQK